MLHSWFEYFLVTASLAATVAIGIYAGRGKTSLQDYMLGNKKLPILPISLSVAATQISGSAIISMAEEVYLYGLPVSLNVFGQIIYGPLFAYVFLPVSYKVKSVSTFEFFDRRFNSCVRIYASLMFAIEMILHTGVSQYIPSVTLSQATGLPVFPISCVLSTLCWIYTSMGGFRAVTYADSFQVVLFMAVILVLFGLGVFYAGGFAEIWNKGTEGYRTELFDWSITYDSRYSVLLIFGGGVLHSLRTFFSASFHQRVVAMPTYKAAKRVTLWSSFLTAVCLIFTSFMGLVVYVYFAGCDPLLEGKKISSHATILPYFVEEISKNIPGLTGLFLSGVIAAGLRLAKAFSILVSTCSVLIIERISSLFEATVTMKSFTSCGSFSLHMVGMILPWINAKGALAGSLISSFVTSYIAVGTQRARSNKLVQYIPKILTNAECVVNGTTAALLNQTVTIGREGFGIVTQSHPNVPWYFKMSFYIYYVPGFFLGLVTSYLVSRLTGHEDLQKLDRDMIIPLMHWALPLHHLRPRKLKSL